MVIIHHPHPASPLKGEEYGGHLKGEELEDASLATEGASLLPYGLPAARGTSLLSGGTSLPLEE
ncbi:MAG: hypothetical protein AB1611_02715 [bacterium]